MCKLRYPETYVFIAVTVMLTAILAVCGLMVPGKAFASMGERANSETGQVAQVEVQEGSLVSVEPSAFQEASQQPVGGKTTPTAEVETARSDGSNSTVSDQVSSLSSSGSELSEGLNADQDADNSSEPSSEPTQPVDLPKLTGFAIVSGNTKVGTTLVAGVEGAPENASLSYQWYRGDSPIAGATANAYTTTIADNGKDITCRVSAAGYEGVLVSGAIRPLSPNQSITVEYWGYTDASPEAEVLLKSETANLTDLFDCKYDQNFDTDKTNDRVAYKLLGWQAEGMSSYYDITLPETEFSTTLQDIAALAGWSDNVPLVFHAVQEVRQITVYYWGNGYEENHDLEPIKVMSWFDVPYLEGIEWKGCALYGQVDDWGDQLDNTMTCGYILSELIDDPWSNELNVYFDWAFLTYEVYLFGYDGLMGINGVCFEDQLDLPTYGLGSYPGYEFVGWFTEPGGAGVQVHEGMHYCDIEPDDKIESINLYAFFTQLDLTGSVQISGGTNVGDTLTATVSGAPTDAQLQYQWYRGDLPIEGATGVSYVLANGDAGSNISCRVTDANYGGTLVSNILGPVNGLEMQAFAVYSKDDRSLCFYKRTSMPVVGDVFAGKTVTEIYTGFENEIYEQEAAPWKQYSSIITNVSVVDDGIAPISTAYWFLGLGSCTGFDLTKLDTSRVLYMNNMFSGCRALTSINLNGFDTSQVTNMRLMFSSCLNLESLDLSGFDTSNVVDMAGMFNSCSKLKSLNVSSFDTSNVVDMTGMFHRCSGLTSLDVKSFDTSQVTEMFHMFYGCSSLVSVDVSSFNTSRVTNMGNMFASCSSLITLDISNFDYSSATRVANMLYQCTSLVSVDVGNLNLATNTQSALFFGGCSSLTTIYSAANADLFSVTALGSDAFARCESLVGGLGTAFDADQISWKYARVDGLGGKAGYFTPKITVSYYDPETGTISTPVPYIYGLKAVESAYASFFGWSLTSDAAEIAFLPGEVITYDPTDVKDIVLYPVLVPALTGTVVISGTPNVGESLAAVVNGVQADALLKCQWYRGDSPIEGATSAAYTLVGEDRGSVITCKVSASNYRGTISSNTLGPITYLVTVEYWSYTDASPNNEVLVHSTTADLGDLFDYRYDQNKDDDPSNDYTGYKCTGWVDDWFFEFYDITTPIDEFTTTLADIANSIEWDGASPLMMHAYTDMRMIEVTYDTGGYDEEYYFDNVQFISWFDSPSIDIVWPTYKFISLTDEKGNLIDDSMTCGYILTELLNDFWGDKLKLYLTWEKIDYKVHYVYPNGIQDTQSVEYGDVLALPSEGPGFDYPGHEFVGWFFERNGSSMQVAEGTIYAQLAWSDTVEEISLYAHFQQSDPVTVEYWAITDTSSDDYVPIRTVQVLLSDYFDDSINQNTDNDSSNDFKGYDLTGWYDSFNFLPVDSSMTIQQLAEMCEWDGTGSIAVYAMYDLRMIAVSFIHSGADGADERNSSAELAWHNPVLCNDYYWQAHRLVSIHDVDGNELDRTMTCGYVLNDLLNDPWTTELSVYYTWEKINYQVHYIYPNGIEAVQDVEYATSLELPAEGPGFEYAGYEFIGWYTQPEGAGNAVSPGTIYGMLVGGDDGIESLNLYAYFRPTESAAPDALARSGVKGLGHIVQYA